MERMSYEEFKKEVEAEVKDYLPDEYKDAKVTIATVSKIGQTYDSLTVRPEGQVASPAANLNAFFEDYENGKPFGRVMDNIADVIQMPAPEHMNDMKWLLDYAQAKDHLFIRVCNAETNEKLVSSAPHKIVDDLVITCHVAVEATEHGLASTIVNNDLLNHYGVSEKQLFDDALISAPTVMPVKMDTMLNVISSMMPEAVSDDMRMDESFPGSNMFIVSNSTMVNGAAAIFYPDVLDEIADQVGGNFVILPSSIHEVIVVPDMGDYKSLENMVKNVNRVNVDPKEQLSDHTYHYDAKDRIFERTDKYEARVAEKAEKRKDRDAR